MVILAATVAVLTIVLAILGATWLNQRAFERQLDQTEKRSDARVDTQLNEIKRLDEKLDAIERRLDRIERRLDAIFEPS